MDYASSVISIYKEIWERYKFDGSRFSDEYNRFRIIIFLRIKIPKIFKFRDIWLQVLLIWFSKKIYEILKSNHKIIGPIHIFRYNHMIILRNLEEISIIEWAKWMLSNIYSLIES